MSILSQILNTTTIKHDIAFFTLDTNTNLNFSFIPILFCVILSCCVIDWHPTLHVTLGILQEGLTHISWHYLQSYQWTMWKFGSIYNQGRSIGFSCSRQNNKLMPLCPKIISFIVYIYLHKNQQKLMKLTTNL